MPYTQQHLKLTNRYYGIISRYIFKTITIILIVGNIMLHFFYSNTSQVRLIRITLLGDQAWEYRRSAYISSYY
jgi:hypothetical protein